MSTGTYKAKHCSKNSLITGINVTSHIFSYLDFKSMVASRMVSKTWYAFIENQRGIWINLMRRCFEDIPKKAHRNAVHTGGTKIQILIAVMPEGGPLTIFGRSVNPVPTGEGRLSPPIPNSNPNVFHLPASLNSIRFYVLITLSRNRNEKG